MSYSNWKALVCDSGGHHVEQAIRLARDLSKVYYYTPWEKGWPVYEDAAIGEGMEGIIRENNFFKRLDEVDIVCFFDIGFGDLAEWLKRKGHKVFGAAQAEELELDRFLLQRRIRDFEMPVRKTVKIKGTKALRDYINWHPEKWIKMNIWRGNSNTFFAKDVPSIDQRLCKLEFEMGPFAQELDFLVCDSIEGIEIGVDGFFGSAGFVYPIMWGFMQDTTYLGKYAWTLPFPLIEHTSKLTELLGEYGYKGPISTEIRTGDGRKAYLTDLTCRFASPLAVIHTEAIKNYTEVICQIAEGKNPLIEQAARFVGCALLTTYEAEKTWEHLSLNPKDRNRVKLFRCAKYKGEYYAVRGEQNGFIIIGLGNSLRQVIDSIKETAERVDAQELEKEPVAHLDRHFEDIKEAEKLGVFLDGSGD